MATRNLVPGWNLGRRLEMVVKRGHSCGGASLKTPEFMKARVTWVMCLVRA